jgi:hypothetical protein
VAEPLLHLLRVLAVRQHERRAGVPQIVKAQTLNLGGVHQAAEASRDVIRVEGAALGIREHVAIVVIGDTARQAVLKLARSVPAKGFDG